MKKILGWIQGTDKIGIWLLIGIGFLGIFLSIWSHASVWRIVTHPGMSPNIYTGRIIPVLIIGLSIVALLLALRSVYAIIPVLFYFIYLFEVLFGTGIFVLIINAGTHKLRPGLYVMMPLSAISMLIGSIGTIIYRVKYKKTS